MLTEMLQQFTDETAGVDEYATCAGKDDELAPMYISMAKAEYEHAKSLAEAIDGELGRERTDSEAKECLEELRKSVNLMLASELSKARGMIER